MTSKLLASFLGTLLLVSQVSFAQNRDDADTAFPDAKVGEGTQILLGIGDLIAAGVLNDMRKVDGLTEGQIRIRSLQADISSLRDDLTDEPVFHPERTSIESEIKNAEKEIAEIRAAELRSPSAVRKLSKTVRRLTIVGQTVVIVDLVGRIYVWNAMDRNPTLSPVATYILHHGAKLTK